MVQKTVAKINARCQMPGLQLCSNVQMLDARHQRLHVKYYTPNPQCPIPMHTNIRTNYLKPRLLRRVGQNYTVCPQSLRKLKLFDNSWSPLGRPQGGRELPNCANKLSTQFKAPYTSSEVQDT
jgi:hypothetical protein